MRLRGNTMPKTKTSPTRRPNLARYNDRIRGDVEARLRRLGRTWNWLAAQVESNGFACRAAINHWGGGLQEQIGSSLYVAVLEILEADEARARKPIRIGREEP